MWTGPITAAPNEDQQHLYLCGEDERVGLGLDVVPLGDADADGFSDFIVGDDGDNWFLVHGPTSGSLTTAEVEDVLRDPDVRTLAAQPLGDIDSDGRDDVLIGGASNKDGVGYTGEVQVFLGGWTGEVTSDEAEIRIGSGTLGAYWTGKAVTSLDADADGHQDIAFTRYLDDPDWRDSTQALLVFGPLEVGTWLPPDLESLGLTTSDPDTYFAEEGLWSGDMDGDNIDDLVVSSPLDDTNGANSGAIWILFGDSLAEAAGR